MQFPKLNKPIYHSRPRAEADWRCPRYRYFSYEWDATGLDADIETIEMFFGTSIHDATAVIAQMWKASQAVDIDLIATTTATQVREGVLALAVGTDDQREVLANEQACLAEGLVRGFYRHQWPLIMKRWPRILAIEADVTYRHDHEGNPDPDGKFEFLAKPDLVVESEDGSERVYIEYKTTSSKREEWINSWDKQVQVHGTREAIKSTLGIDCTGVVVQGFYKGYESYGKLATPLAYAYHRWGNPPFSQTETVYEYKAGYRRYPVWELEGGCKKWVDNMPSEVLMEQFPETPTIFPDPAYTRAFFAQRAIRELDIRFGRDVAKAAKDAGDLKSLESVLTVTFPQKFRECKQARRNGECPMLHLCFGDIKDPLKAGMSPRTPHHKAEIDSMEVVDDQS